VFVGKLQVPVPATFLTHGATVHSTYCAVVLQTVRMCWNVAGIINVAECYTVCLRHRPGLSCV